MTPTTPVTGQGAAALAVAEYIDLMHSQREALFADLRDLSAPELWYRPGPGQWSIGENLDHVRVLDQSSLRVFRLALALTGRWATRQTHRRPALTIDNVYLRPGFPQRVGWIWPPKYSPMKPTSLATLHDNLRIVHEKVAAFFNGHDPLVLGHAWLWDPAIGRLTLIQTLRVGLFHDQLHFDEVRARLVALERAR